MKHVTDEMLEALSRKVHKAVVVRDRFGKTLSFNGRSSWSSVSAAKSSMFADIRHGLIRCSPVVMNLTSDQRRDMKWEDWDLMTKEIVNELIIDGHVQIGA